jgi:hypothetical protein
LLLVGWQNPCKPWAVVTWSYQIPKYLRPTELAMKTMKNLTAGGILATDEGKYKSEAFVGPRIENGVALLLLDCGE